MLSFQTFFSQIVIKKKKIQQICVSHKSEKNTNLESLIFVQISKMGQTLKQKQIIKTTSSGYLAAC